MSEDASGMGALYDMEDPDFHYWVRPCTLRDGDRLVGVRFEVQAAEGYAASHRPDLHGLELAAALGRDEEHGEGPFDAGSDLGEIVYGEGAPPASDDRGVGSDLERSLWEFLLKISSPPHSSLSAADIQVSFPEWDAGLALVDIDGEQAVNLCFLDEGKVRWVLRLDKSSRTGHTPLYGAAVDEVYGPSFSECDQ